MAKSRRRIANIFGVILVKMIIILSSKVELLERKIHPLLNKSRFHSFSIIQYIQWFSIFKIPYEGETIAFIYQQMSFINWQQFHILKTVIILLCNCKFIINMATYFLLTLASLILLCSSQSYQGVYAFSWLAGHCQYQMQMKHEYCDPTWVAPWDNQSLTIHGIWPSNPTTLNFGKFNIKIFQDNLRLLDDMNNYWPPKTKASTTNVFLWEHEWDTHGHDYAANIYALRPDEFAGTTEQRNERLQLTFFQEAVNFYKKFSVKKIGKNILTKGEVANLFGINENQFIFVCAKSNLVRQIQVCFQTTKQGNIISNCTKSTSTCTNSGQTIELMSWAAKRQDRVYNYINNLLRVSQE